MNRLKNSGGLAVIIILIACLIAIVAVWSVNRSSSVGPALSGGGSPLPTATPAPTATPQPTATPGVGFIKNQGLAIHDAATPTSSDVSGIPNIKLGGSGSFFPSAADTYYEPFYVESEININRISLERTDANPAQDCSVGIYNADNNWQPTTLEVDFSPLTLAGGGAAWNHKTVNYNLPAGSYLSAYLCNGAPLGVFLGETDISFAIENTTGFAVVFTRWNVDVPSISPATPFPATGDTWDDYLLQGTADNTFWSLVYRYTVN